MNGVLARCGLLLAVACGYHDTPVATYNAPLPDGSQGGSLAGSAGAVGGGGAAAGGSAGTAGSLMCPDSYDITVPGLTSRYREATIGQIWVDAETDCESDGGHLIVIDDEAENTWMASIAAKAITNNKSTHELSWIGLHDQTVGGEFRWVTGTPLTLALWADMEPNSLYDDEDCVEIRAAGQWNDDRCDAPLTYVCECDGIPSAGEWCDTQSPATCGDCNTTCGPDQECIGQQCM